MKGIIGLGNPGTEYVGTRHNVGFSLVDRIADREGVGLRKGRCRALEARVFVLGTPLLLARPTTYMNLSGESVRRLLDWHGLEATQWIVVYDDVSLPIGRIRIRPRGSAGGHKGMRSIIQHTGGEEFPRLRIGVGGAGRKNLADHVLGRFREGERTGIEQGLDLSIQALDAWIELGIDAAMNRYNAKESTEQDKGA